MSNDVRKKESEIQILKKVFGAEIVYEESEQPDFILKYGENIRHGVEISELYYDGTSARLKKEKYIKDLLRRKNYWHKEDKKKLKVHDIQYYSKDKDYQPIQTSAVFLPKYTVQNYARSLKKTIEIKNKKLEKYCSNISNSCRLIIYDKENPFEKLNEKDVARQLFGADLSKVIRESGYKEIYLVTKINKENKYIPLKAYLLQSDFLLFVEFVKERNLGNKLEKTCKHPLFAFAEILTRRGHTVSFGKVDNDDVIGKIVVYSGMYGIGMVTHDNDDWGVGVFDTYPLQNIPNTVELKLERNEDFFDDDLYMAYERIVQKKIASVGLFFSTK